MLARLVALFGSTAWAILVSQAVGPVPDPYSDALSKLLVSGPFGVCLALVIGGVLSPPSTVKALSERVVRAEQQRDAATTQLIEGVVPVLTLVNQTVVPSLDRSATAKDAMARELARLSDEQGRLREDIATLRAELRARPSG